MSRLTPRDADELSVLDFDARGFLEYDHVTGQNPERECVLTEFSKRFDARSLVGINFDDPDLNWEQIKRHPVSVPE